METEAFGLVLAIVVLVIFALVATILIFFAKYKTNILKIEKEKQLALFKAVVDAEEEQKKKIAKNLHDEIMTSTTLLAQYIDNKYIDDTRATELIEQIMSGLQAISLDLIPKSLFNFGLVKAVEQYVRLLNREDAIDVEIEDNIKEQGTLQMNEQVQVNVYRICLEILNNLKKHVRYSFIRITFALAEDSLIIDFSHNGEGVTNEEIRNLTEISPGLGLKSLETRLLILNGQINYHKEIRNSTITLIIPVE